jgi:hypothetical protein
MVQFVQLPQSARGRLSDSLGESIGLGLANFTGNYFANKKLEEVLNDPDMQDADLSKRQSRLQSALDPYGKFGQNVLQKRMSVEQQLQKEQSQNALSSIQTSFEENKPLNPKDLKKLDPDTQLKVLNLQKRRNQGNQIYKSLIKAGYSEETAELYKNQIEASSEGGITSTINDVNKLLSRSPIGKGSLPAQEQKPLIKTSIEIPGIENKEYELDFPDFKDKIGRTQAESVKEEGKNREINTPVYSQTIDSLNALEEDLRDYQQLQEYNQMPGVLPSGAEKWNIDWDTGDIRFKALANPETQGYAKTIARLLGRAKEYFPGRVTNFDLHQFKQRFPQLANSPEGRELITKQLILANRIAYLNEETLKEAIDHYGADADPVQIKKIANANYRRLKQELEGDLKGLNEQADTMLNPQSNMNSQVPEGSVKVKFNGVEGTMRKEQYERAKADGKPYELVR